MAFVEWMMGYPPGWVDGITRTAALRCLGNAVVPQQGERAMRGLARTAALADPILRTTTLCEPATYGPESASIAPGMFTSDVLRQSHRASSASDQPES